MNLTLQQQTILASKGNIKINAVAGSGKTTTIIEYAKTRPLASKILYLAFNKSVKLEAEHKFAQHRLSNVRIETAHSLAYRQIVIGSTYTIKQGDYKPYELVRLLGMTGSSANHELFIIANHILKMASLFCNSMAQKVAEIDYIKTITDTKAKAFVKYNFKNIEYYTRQFLAKMDRGEIEITHDFYLKKFQLSNPILPFDYILFDEGQDASPAMLDIFLKQQFATKVIVGDTHQQIYSWRYAINSLEQVDFISFDLNNSFRFGKTIATLANDSLYLKNKLSEFNPFEVIGLGTNKETKTQAVIARTNLGLLIKAITYITDHRKVKHIYFEGNFNSYTYADEGASLYDVLNLYNKKHFLIRDELLKTMRSITELEDYIEKTEDKQLQMMLDIVKEYENEIPSLLKQLKDKHVGDAEKHKAEIIFSTVHRCKGMEYDVVELANDFITEDKLERLSKQPEFKEQKSRIEEEINLLYVAITRAKTVLKIPEEMLPENFVLDVSVVVIKKPEPVLKQEIALPNYAVRKKSSYLQEFDSHFSKIREKSPSAYRPWNDELDEELETMFDSGKTYQEMSVEFERSKGAIISRLKKLGLIPS
jgi:superfamily I DNA/RNA helicase